MPRPYTILDDLAPFSHASVPESAWPRVFPWHPLASSIPKLVAVATRVPGNIPDLVLKDSLDLKYSGTRGGNLTTVLKYDSFTSWKNWNYAGTILTGDERSVQTFDTADRLTSQSFEFFDLFKQRWVDSSRSMWVIRYNSQGQDSMREITYEDRTTNIWTPGSRILRGMALTGCLPH